MLARFFSDAGDQLAKDIHQHYSKLLGVAAAGRGHLGNQSPLGWTSAQFRTQIYNFLGMDQRFDPLSPLRDDSRVLNTALRIAADIQLWDESTVLSRLPAWLGQRWSIRALMARSKKEDLSWADAEPLSVAETQEWAKFREYDIHKKIEKQIEIDGYDGVIEAGARGISILQPVDAADSPAGRRDKTSRLGPKERDYSFLLDGAGLTARQHQCYSLCLEYGLPIAEIARRVGITRKTVDEHILAAKAKIDNQTAKYRSDRNYAKKKPGESRTDH